MTVHFDPDTGRLRLDAETFQSLVTWAGGGEADPGRMAELDAAGAVRRDQPHPSLATGLGAVADPLCRLAIGLRNGHGRDEAGEGWVNGQAAALVLDLPDGLREFVAVHPTFLPAALARIIQLGPRPRLTAEPVQVSNETLTQLTEPDPQRRQAAVETLLSAAPTPENAAAVRALGSPLRRRSVVQARWTAPGGALGGRALYLLDTEAGLWLLESDSRGSVVWPTTPTAIWRALVLLLPRDPELA